MEKDITEKFKVAVEWLTKSQDVNYREAAKDFIKDQAVNGATAEARDYATELIKRFSI